MPALRTLTLTVVICIAALAPSEGRARSADLRISASGVAEDGEAMRVACELEFLALPSNVFGGACRISVGPDELALVGAVGDDARAPTVVLHHGVTIRAVPDAATGRFAGLAADRSEFPVHLSLDPLRRHWAIHVDHPDTRREPLASGHLTGGRIVFAIP